jgi:predicted dehydrogenase
MPPPASRRDFLKATALAGAGVLLAGQQGHADVAAPAPTTAPTTSPSDKLNIACIGVGGKGGTDSAHAGKYGNLVAICDVDNRYLDQKSAAFPQAKKFNDFRKMLTEMDKSIDAVVVSTPDHTHAAAAVMAMKMGKHVYCQKPLAYSISEARLMRETARQHNVVTQMGNQGTSFDEFRRGVEILRSDLLGPVKEVHVWTNRPIWPQAPAVTTRPAEAVIPPYLHWDQWIGPAPMRAYNPAYHPFKWRGFRDFGSGALGDMGCHTCNLPFMGLELGFPNDVQGEGGDINDETYPSWATVVFNFPARGHRPPVKLTWWEGHKKNEKTKELIRNIPTHRITHGFDLPESGSLVIGENGMLISISDYGYTDRLIFDSSSEGFNGKIPQLLPRIGGGDDKQKAEWIDAIKGGPKPLSNFDYAGMLTEFILLGNIAVRANKKPCNGTGLICGSPTMIRPTGICSANIGRDGRCKNKAATEASAPG